MQSQKTQIVAMFLSFSSMQIMTCAPAPPVSSSARTISAEWCAPVIPATATTASATVTERSPTAWVAALASRFRAVAVVAVDVTHLSSPLDAQTWTSAPTGTPAPATRSASTRWGASGVSVRRASSWRETGEPAQRAREVRTALFSKHPPPFLFSETSFHNARDLVRLAAGCR